MPSNTSATGGYVAASQTPDYDKEFMKFLQQVVAGVTGLPGNLVRPRWQEEPPASPPANTDWVAIGTRTIRSDPFPAVLHNPTGDGSDELYRHEEFELLCSFYGPHGDGNATALRDGLSIAQNREALFLAKMGIAGFGDIVSVPSLVQERWRYRADLSVQMRRQVKRVYPILNLVSVQGTIITTAQISVNFNA